MRLSRTQLLAALAPIISVISGGLATWLFVHVHELGVFATQQQLARLIASVVTFGVTTGLVWASTHLHIQAMLLRQSERADGAPIAIPPLQVLLGLLGPYISVVAGWIAAYLAVKVHALSIFHVDHTQLMQTVAASIVFIVTSVVTWLSNHDVVTETL